MQILLPQNFTKLESKMTTKQVRKSLGGKTREYYNWLNKYNKEQVRKSTSISNIVNKLNKKKLAPKSKNPKTLKEKYDKYINSFYWRKRRELYFSLHQKKCSKCNSIKNIVLHHGTYINLRNEKDDDLFALCRECHNNLHKKYGVKEDMILETIAYINDKEKLLFDIKI